MDFKLVLLLALCCTLAAAYTVDHLDENSEEPPHTLRKVNKRDDHDTVFYNYQDKDGKDAFSVQDQGDIPKQKVVKRRSNVDDDKPGCCG